MKKTRPIRIGDMAPSSEGRTDEGTPISLADFKGRALSVFPMGKGLDKSQRSWLKALAKKTGAFLETECSPVVVSAEPHEVIGSFRVAEDLPFLIISDTELSIHLSLTGQAIAGPFGAWVFNEDGVLAAIVPPMPIRELFAATLAALARVGCTSTSDDPDDAIMDD